MDLNIGDNFEFKGREGVVIKVGRLGLSHALTVRWKDTDEIVAFLNKGECKQIAATKKNKSDQE